MPFATGDHFLVSFFNYTCAQGMNFQCANCEKVYGSLQKLRRHYLTYLPFYFGSYVCLSCELRFESEAKLRSHTSTKRHTNKSQSKHWDISEHRIKYFQDTNNLYIGESTKIYTESDINLMMDSTVTTNIDLSNAQAAMDRLMDNDDFDASTSYNAVSPVASTAVMDNYVQQQVLNTAAKLSYPVASSVVSIPVQQNTTTFSESSEGVPSPPNLRMRCHTPLQDEETQKDAMSCCCDKIRRLEEQVNRQHSETMTSVQQNQRKIIDSLGKAMKYSQELLKSAIAQSRNSQKPVTYYLTIVAEMTLKMLKPEGNVAQRK